MAYIDVSNIEKEEKKIKRENQSTVRKTTYLVDGDFFQINTYGSEERKYPDKVSQALLFDKNGLKKLVKLIKKEFPDI